MRQDGTLFEANGKDFLQDIIHFLFDADSLLLDQHSDLGGECDLSQAVLVSRSPSWDGRSL
jgi:hypothetical protein